MTISTTRSTERDNHLDSLNRPAWSDPASVAIYEGTEVWSDPGERIAVHSIASEARGCPILDVGVGGGRTASFLRLLSDDYIGIDYTQAMVDSCNLRLPELDIRLGDARDLSQFADGQFGLVVFSFNGIDSVDHDGRRKALSEFHRVLRADGLLLFSTLNKDGPSFKVTPWSGTRCNAGQGVVRRIVKFTARLPLSVPRYVRTYRNWWQNRRHVTDHGGWGIGLLAAHDLGLLVHYVTFDAALEELAVVGFAPIGVFAVEDGRLLASAREASGVDYFHVAARKLTS